MSEESQSELDRFREQWRKEFKARSRAPATLHRARPGGSQASLDTSVLISPTSSTTKSFSSSAVAKNDKEEDFDDDTLGDHVLNNKDDARRPRKDSSGTYSSYVAAREPRSALEHYEKAVEKEDSGNLGDSLAHYRKAYRV